MSLGMLALAIYIGPVFLAGYAEMRWGFEQPRRRGAVGLGVYFGFYALLWFLLEYVFPPWVGGLIYVPSYENG